MTTKTIAFATLGCKLNFTETSAIARSLDSKRYSQVEFNECADIYVVQSCTVTAAAEKKCRSLIRQARRRNPESLITVMGCMAQLNSSSLMQMQEVDLIVGNADKFRLDEILASRNHESSKQEVVSKINDIRSFEPSFSFERRTRAFVKIQDGCNYLCSYCAIPLARGRSRSSVIAETIQTIKTVVENGAKEIVLSGVNIGMYGTQPNETLLTLLKEILKMGKPDRIRLSSIEPDLLDDEIIALVAENKQFMPHFHLPVQSGSDTVLKRMGRKYTTSTVTDKVLKIKLFMPSAFIAADVISGFPGETDKEFEETYALLDKLPFSYLHVFPFSSRPNTKAALMSQHLPYPLIKSRVAKLNALSKSKKIDFYRENTGGIENVLFEDNLDSGFISGYTSNYLRYKTLWDNQLVNQIRTVTLKQLNEEPCFIG